MESRVNRFLIVPVLEGHFGATVLPYSAKLRCPFHDDRHASGWHNDYYFKCLACEVKGDAVGLLNRQGGLSFAEAYRKAEEFSGKPEEGAPSPVLRSHMRGSARTLRGRSRFGTGSTGTS